MWSNCASNGEGAHTPDSVDSPNITWFLYAPLGSRLAPAPGGVDERGSSLEGEVVPFMACGDLSGYDADMSYPLEAERGRAYVHLAPVQAPIAPPYRTALALEKEQRGASKT
eukprot:9411988-Pyramimonas_sp.AAC.1